MKPSPFSTEFLRRASELDEELQAGGVVMKAATAIMERQDRTATLSLIHQTADIIASKTAPVKQKRMANDLKECLLKIYGYHYLIEQQTHGGPPEEDTRTLKELLEALNALVGLREVKAKVNDLVDFQTIRLLRERQGLRNQKTTLHLAFTGNPGTGKTTVARIVGRIYKQLGLLSKGHFTEVSRTDLIAGYQGQTALKVKAVIEKAKGGVLFIDEAYSITENDKSDAYGRECLTELTKALEDYRNDLVVIVAGYTQPMEEFFKSNLGLKSRFNTFITFPDYSAEELFQILLSLCSENDYCLSEAAQAKIRSVFEAQSTTKAENFANGRMVRNFYDSLVMHHAKRVVALGPHVVIDRALLSTIEPEDVVTIEPPRTYPHRKVLRFSPFRFNKRRYSV